MFNFEIFNKLFRDVFTGRDNQSFDIGRVLWFQGVQAYMLLTAYSIYKGAPFDPISWGGGLAALLGAGAAALGLKIQSEPQPIDNRDGRRDDDTECRDRR